MNALTHDFECRRRVETYVFDTKLGSIRTKVSRMRSEASRKEFTTLMWCFKYKSKFIIKPSYNDKGVLRFQVERFPKDNLKEAQAEVLSFAKDLRYLFGATVGLR